MKKQYIIPMVAAALFSSSTVIADGATAWGTVAADTYDMTADFSVRYNSTPAAADHWVYAEFSTSSRQIVFSGYGGWATFYCRVLPGSPLYDKALKIALNFNNGYTITASKQSGWTNYNCASVDMEFDTQKLHWDKITVREILPNN